MASRQSFCNSQKLHEVDQEISDLEHRLQKAKASRRRFFPPNAPSSVPIHMDPMFDASCMHNILLLGDSALPLGSFAYSSALESFLAHQPKTARSRGLANFIHFLNLSLASLASTNVPFVFAAYHDSEDPSDLDNDLDASTTCCVAKRASIAQGKALITLWDKSLRIQAENLTDIASNQNQTRASDNMERFVQFWKAPGHGMVEENRPQGHLAPLFGLLCAAMSIPVEQSIYLFLLNHAKTLLSAAIRASAMGPYQAQGVLAGAWLKGRIYSIVRQELTAPRCVDQVGQTVPMLDIWGGRHEIVYSRIFNS